jgi:hypothetical protein
VILMPQGRGADTHGDLVGQTAKARDLSLFLVLSGPSGESGPAGLHRRNQAIVLSGVEIQVAQPFVGLKRVLGFRRSFDDARK